MAQSEQPRLVALRHHDFRMLWFGQMLSMIGGNMQQIAVNWHVYELLRGQAYTLLVFGRSVELGAEALGLGALGLVRIIPVTIFALLGGALADTVDRRKLLIWANTVQVIPALLLAVIALSNNTTIPLLYLLTAIGAAANTFELPARQAIVPNIVPREHVSNAVSLISINWQVGAIIGPALAGIMVAAFPIGYAYAATAIFFALVLIALLRVRYRGGAAATDAGVGFSAITEGMRFVYTEKLIWGSMLLDFFATFFSSARLMLPIIADQILKVGSTGYGILATAQPVGALIAGLIVALRKEIKQQGVVLLVSVAIYGVATALFGISTGVVLSYILFALTGAGDTVSTVIRGTIRQLATPDRLRGRMMGINMIFFMGGPQLGELEAGLVAAAFGAPIAILTGGIATVLLTAWVAFKYPRLRDFTNDMYAELAEQ